MNRIYCIALMSLFLLCSVGLFAQKINHPLDPLSWQEYWVVLETLKNEGHLDGSTGFSHINLVPPDKNSVWNWKKGMPYSRKAFAVVHQDSLTYRAQVDLNTKKLEKWELLKGIQPTWLGREFGAMVEDIKKHPDVIKAMKKRGYDDLTFVSGGVGPPGYFGTEEQVGRRIGHAHFRDPRGVRNPWGRGIGGLTVVVDLHSKEILRVVDEEEIPVPTKNVDFDEASIENKREVPGPIFITQPNGTGFQKEGNIIEWQKWKFHVKPDHRVGMIISTVTYQDGDKERKVMYEGYLSEIFVPYMDPAFDWYHRNFIDAGEYTQGGLAKPLERGLDAPDYAQYMDALVITDAGRPRQVPNILAIFERETGDPSWRHYAGGIGESRTKKDLIIRSAAVLGNYDYIFDWIFQQDGSIRVLVGATGIAEAKPSATKDASSKRPKGSDGDDYGRFVDPNIVAVNHSHFFSFRIDFDVDGGNNTLLIDKLRTKELPEDSPRRSIWVREPMVAKTEKDAMLKIDLNKPALWRVLSESTKNHVGYPTSYQLMPGKTGNTLLSEDDFPRRRAGFINYHLWATPYMANERFAAGDFPTLSTPGQGLPEWTANNRNIENKDIVLWYTVGMHHLVRAEDWPVMPVLWHSFELRPFDFFSGNPALDLPKVRR